MIDRDLQPLIDRYEAIAPNSLRVVVAYEGDEYETIHVRDDVKEMYSPEEFEEQIKQLVIEGVSDPPALEQFRLFGTMEVAIRQFQKAIVLHYPRDEFAGVAITFDREPVPSVETLADIGTAYFAGELENADQ